MDKKLEEAIKKSLSNKERGTCVISAEILETVLNHIKNSISKEVIEEKLMKYFDINTNNCMAYNLTRVKEAKQYGTLTIDDFVEFDEETINDIVNYIFKK